MLIEVNNGWLSPQPVVELRIVCPHADSELLVPQDGKTLPGAFQRLHFKMRCFHLTDLLPTPSIWEEQ